MENEELFFCGDFSHALDTQFRVTLPSAWRCGEGDPHLVLFPGRDNDLLLFPYSIFREFLIRARSSALANPATQAALAQIGRVVRDIRPDKQGRIKLEKEMLAAIGVEKELMMVGVQEVMAHHNFWNKVFFPLRCPSKLHFSLQRQRAYYPSYRLHLLE